MKLPKAVKEDMPQIIWPSVMAKSQREMNLTFRRLEGVVKELHLDIADGKFVPNTSLDFPLRLSSRFSYNAHLMIENPQAWIKKYKDKVALFIPHYEAVSDVSAYISWMRKMKKKVAFALKPETEVQEVKPYLQDIDYILILTVHPGFYGANYLKSPLKKIAQIKKINPSIEIIVDGGMAPETIKQAKKAGADYFVSGSYTTKAENPQERIKNLVEAIKKV